MERDTWRELSFGCCDVGWFWGYLMGETMVLVILWAYNLLGCLT